MKGWVVMDLLSFFLKEDVSPIGLSDFKAKKKEDYLSILYQNVSPQKQYFKPDYSNNFFLL